MTLVQKHTRSTSTDAVMAAAASTDPAGPQVWDAMSVEVALSVMAAAGVGHLAICDEDGLCTGLVTLARLSTVRDSSGYTDRIRLRDIAAGEWGPLAPPLFCEASCAVSTPDSPTRHHLPDPAHGRACTHDRSVPRASVLLGTPPSV